MVVVEKLTKVAFFILVELAHKEANIEEIYLKELLGCMGYLRQLF
jgi:hypothetical protein